MRNIIMIIVIVFLLFCGAHDKHMRVQALWRGEPLPKAKVFYRFPLLTIRTRTPSCTRARW